MIADDDLQPAWITRELLPVLTDPARLAAMADGSLRAAARTGHRQAAAALVQLIRAAAGGPQAPTDVRS
jgi:UDP-N-acetylglucosamine--N-acetylmuramyl-(pentapeptide) pyrophosphoryl-undecaprenol N-acetylglucosamine transferase